MVVYTTDRTALENIETHSESSESGQESVALNWRDSRVRMAFNAEMSWFHFLQASMAAGVS